MWGENVGLFFNMGLRLPGTHILSKRNATFFKLSETLVSEDSQNVAFLLLLSILLTRRLGGEGTRANNGTAEHVGLNTNSLFRSGDLLEKHAPVIWREFVIITSL